MPCKFRAVFLTLLLLMAFGCGHFDKTVCGEPEGEEKQFIDSLNLVFQNKLIIEQVPCYPGYIQAHLKTSVPNETLDSINAVCRNKNYIEFLVYDKEGNLIRGSIISM